MADRSKKSAPTQTNNNPIRDQVNSLFFTAAVELSAERQEKMVARVKYLMKQRQSAREALANIEREIADLKMQLEQELAS